MPLIVLFFSKEVAVDFCNKSSLSYIGMTHQLNLHVLSALVFVYDNDIARASGWKDVASH